jgi:hypothetical protein
MLVLIAAPRAWTVDEETTRLERAALCQALPYRCPGFDPGQDAQTVQAQQTNQLCSSLEPHQYLILSKRSHQEPLDAADIQAEKTWKASCGPWKRQQQRERQQAAAARAITRSSSTLDCITTWDDGPYSSRLTTTCTSY